LSEVPSEETQSFSPMAQALAHIKENPAAYAVGLLILQQLGWISKATTELQGVCF
jgi:hypothetical protein